EVKTGKLRWFYQFVHHDVWNHDIPDAPHLLDITVNGRQIPAIAQATKQGWLYVFNRETGEPVWPIEERPVPASRVPGEKLSKTQPFPTRPAPYEIQGLEEDELIDFTPELRAQMLEILEEYQTGPLFNPPLDRDNELGKKAALWCPGDIGGVNIDGPPVADPATGILYVTSRKHCSYRILAPGRERDALLELPTGTTVADYVVLPGFGSVQGPGGLNMFKPPYSRITAIDMNTGEHLWWIPVGETPDRVRNHPALQGIDVPNTGYGLAVAPMTVTPTLLIYAGQVSDGTPYLFAVDKATGQELARVEAPEVSAYGVMTYVHQGKQYLLLQTGSRLTAMALFE
ncbi:MAG: pyrroloquinoline quinone-dependent dehydrogenase, partial [Woeseiaceae bacterium]